MIEMTEPKKSLSSNGHNSMNVRPMKPEFSSKCGGQTDGPNKSAFRATQRSSAAAAATRDHFAKTI